MNNADLPNPTKILKDLERGREELGMANIELKKIGYERASARGIYYEKTAISRYENLGKGKSAAASDAIANGEFAELLAKYKDLDAQFETQAKYCKHISAQLNALQTIMNGLKAEWNATEN